MSKNLNKKNDVKINKIPSTKIKEIHIPANSSITTKPGSLFSTPFFSKLVFNEIKLNNKIGTRISNRAK